MNRSDNTTIATVERNDAFQKELGNFQCIPPAINIESPLNKYGINFQPSRIT